MKKLFLLFSLLFLGVVQVEAQDDLEGYREPLQNAQIVLTNSRSVCVNAQFQVDELNGPFQSVCKGAQKASPKLQKACPKLQKALLLSKASEGFAESTAEGSRSL